VTAQVWPLSKAHEETNPVRTHTPESQTSAQQAEGTTQEPAVNPDAYLCLVGKEESGRVVYVAVSNHPRGSVRSQTAAGSCRTL